MEVLQQQLAHRRRTTGEPFNPAFLRLNGACECRFRFKPNSLPGIEWGAEWGHDG